MAEVVTSNYVQHFYPINTYHSQLRSWFGVLRGPYVRFQHLLLNIYIHTLKFLYRTHLCEEMR